MIRRVASFTNSPLPSTLDSRPSINSERDLRVRIDPGTLFAMGYLLVGAGLYRHRLVNAQPGCTPFQFPAGLDDDITEGYAADWTIEQLREPAQRVADRIEALLATDVPGPGPSLVAR